MVMAMVFAAAARTLSFTDLPYAEGTVYVEAKDGDKVIGRKAVPVEGDTIRVEFDLSGCAGKTLFIQAFQDLNDNKTLDFGDYGRPEEPCLQTSISVDGGDDDIVLRLREY